MKFFSDKLLACAILIAMFMVAVEVPFWTGMFALFFVFWKFLTENSNIPKASKKLTGTLSLILLGVILFQYRTLVGQEPAYSYLLSLTALKLMDYENLRDRRFVILLGFILVSVKALFSVDIYWLLPTLFCFVALWLSLFPLAYKNRLRTFQRIAIWSLPLTLILFFAFPRVVLPWALARSNPQGQIGFSDSLAPGKVAELAAQDQLVMRVKLYQELRLSQLYWKGSVLKESLGLTWAPKKLEQFAAAEGDQFVTGSYEIALEPLAEKFLFVLEGTKSIKLPAAPFIGYEGGVFRLLRSQKQTVFYQGVVAEKSLEPLIQIEDDPGYLQVPDLPPRAANWVEEVRAQHPEASARLLALDRFFKEEGFIYTLKPGTYTGQELDEFLFDRKKGFCEHYAGAYGTLARALGIPARVVVGYQGGRYNPWGDFWMVSQKDAHAWVELFYDGQWIRKDPTQWVAPLRFEIGAEDFFALSPEQQIQFAKNLEWKPAASQLQDYFEFITTLFENLNYHWTYFLIEFDLSAQRELLAQLMGSDRDLSVIFGLLIASLLSILIVIQLKRWMDLDERALLNEIKRNYQLPQELPPYSAIAQAQDLEGQHQKFFEDLQNYFDLKWYQEKDPKAFDLIKLNFQWLRIKGNYQRKVGSSA